MSPLSDYYRLMGRLFESRHDNAPPELEDTVLDEMDLVWQRMSAEERKTVDELSRSIATDAMSEEQFITRYIMPDYQSPIPPVVLQLPESPFIRDETNATAGIPKTQTTYYLGFQPRLDRLRIQSPMSRPQDASR